MSADRIGVGGLWVAVPATVRPSTHPATARTEHLMNPPGSVSDAAAHAALRRWYADGSPWSPTETTRFEPGEIAAMRAAIGAADEARSTSPHQHRPSDPDGTDGEAARAQVERLLTLLSDLVDPDPCWIDHHGGCQAHGYLSLEPGERCPVAEAKDVLIAAGRSVTDADPA